MKNPLQCFPQGIGDQYKIMDSVDKDGFFNAEIRKGVYGLNQASHIAFDHLVKLLKPHGYYPIRSNPRIWFHEMLPKRSALCVGDFGITYTNTSHAHHLVDTLKTIQHNINRLGRKKLLWNNFRLES